MSKFSDASNRLLEAAEVLLENLDDAGENTDEDGKIFSDIRELRKAIEGYKKAWGT